MPQRLEFPVLPGADDQSYWPKLRALIEFVDEARPNRRELREFMQDQETWDRDRFEPFFDLVQVEKQGKRYRLGKVARQLLDAADDEQRRLTVVRRIVSENPILIRCMFDALEERLFSDAELWRYLTSHVYPGEHVGGAEFRDWMRWMRLCGVVRVIGIRFGFCAGIDEIKRLVGRIDVEEELMDEEDDDEDDDDVDASPSRRDKANSSPPSVQAGGGAPQAADAEAPTTPDEDDRDDDEEDDQEAAAEERSTSRPPVEAEVVPLRRAMTRAFGAGQIAENRERMDEWWRGFDERRLSRAEDLGVMSLAYESGDKRVFLLQMVAVALTVAGDPRPADRFGFFNALNRARFFHRLIDDRAEFFKVLDELEWFAGDPGQRALAENLLHLVPLRDALLDDAELPDKLAAVADPAQLLSTLAERAYASPIEGLWLVRELCRMGIWGGDERPDIAAAAGVPSPSAVETAWRLGLHDRPQADDAAEALAAARAISGVDEALDHFATAHGCRRACPNAPVCPYHCRERTLAR